MVKKAEKDNQVRNAARELARYRAKVRQRREHLEATLAELEAEYNAKVAEIQTEISELETRRDQAAKDLDEALDLPVDGG